MLQKTIIIFIFLPVLLTAAAFLGPEKSYNFYNYNPYPSPIIKRDNQFYSEAFVNQEKNDFSFLLLGKAGNGYQGGNLADAILVVNYQPSKKSVSLISLPRDLYGNFGGQNFKINEIIWRNKINDLLLKLPEIIGLETNKFLIIDLALVEKFINEINGIDVNLPSDIIDSVSGYRLKSGQHHLNGEDAVWILRNRFSEEGDFFREKNQHLIISAIYNRYQSLNPIEKMKLFLNLGSVTKFIRTNMSFFELISLINNMNNIKIQGTVLDFSTGLLLSSSTPVASSTAYILIPKAGIDNYEEIKKFINSKI